MQALPAYGSVRNRTHAHTHTLTHTLTHTHTHTHTHTNNNNHKTNTTCATCWLYTQAALTKSTRACSCMSTCSSNSCSRKVLLLGPLHCCSSPPYLFPSPPLHSLDHPPHGVSLPADPPALPLPASLTITTSPMNPHPSPTLVPATGSSRWVAGRPHCLFLGWSLVNTSCPKVLHSPACETTSGSQF